MSLQKQIPLYKAKGARWARNDDVVRVGVLGIGQNIRVPLVINPDAELVGVIHVTPGRGSGGPVPK
jgi:hypothetical protein